MKVSNLMTKQHDLNILEDFADDVLMGYKTFEIRENDRGFNKGDTIRFTCIDKRGMKLQHSINDKAYEITYGLNGGGLKNGYVVFGIKERESE